MQAAAATATPAMFATELSMWSGWPKEIYSRNFCCFYSTVNRMPTEINRAKYWMMVAIHRQNETDRARICCCKCIHICISIFAVIKRETNHGRKKHTHTQKRNTQMKSTRKWENKNKQKINKTCHFASEHAFNAKLRHDAHSRSLACPMCATPALSLSLCVYMYVSLPSDFRENGIRSTKHSSKFIESKFTTMIRFSLISNLREHQHFPSTNIEITHKHTAIAILSLLWNSTQ